MVPCRKREVACGSMKQVVAKAGKVEVVEVPQPVCNDNGLLVRTQCSVISTGTEAWTIGATEPITAADLAKDTATAKKAVGLTRVVLRQEGVSGLVDYIDMVRHPEVALGYSSSGTVVEVGRLVGDVAVGDLVACAGEGKATHSEVASVSRNLLVKVPQGVSMDDASFSALGAIAVHAFRRGGAQVGDNVCVIGAGLVGNLVGQIAKASGCRVACIDMREDRLELARTVGLDLQLRTDDPALIQHVSHFTAGRGFDCVFICAATSGNEPVNMAAEVARIRGRLVVVGRVGMDLDRNHFYKKELDLVMSRSLGPGRYDAGYEERGVDYPIEYVRWTLNRNMESFLEMLRKQQVNVKALVGKSFDLDQAREAFEHLGKGSGVAVLLAYKPTDTISRGPGKHETLEAPSFIRGGAVGPVNVALVGPGNFAKETLIPILRRSKSYNLRWIVSSSPIHATQLQRRYSAERSTCDYDEVLNDPETNLIVVSTPNNLHAPMVLDALKAGKAVFVEKPLCLNRDELQEIRKAQEKSNLPVVVGFNRRYSPLVLKLKARMKTMDGPFVILYRVNAGFIPSSRWVQDPVLGGGRVIAECCHFLDLFNFLIGRQDAEVSALAAGISGSTSVSRDNVSVSLKYGDGSVATLVYTAMGDKGMDRERLEVFGQGTSIVINDFKELTVFGNPPYKELLKRSDKGHEREFEELTKYLHGRKSSMISIEELFSSMELTFSVEERLRNSRETDRYT